jgi:prephenate dehydrogenase
MEDGRRQLPVIQSDSSSSSPPVFKKIAVIGLGLVGGSIALAARGRWPECLVIGVDNKEVLELAMLRHAIDVAADDLGVIGEADLVILAAPVRQNIELLDKLDEHLEGDTVITDVGSTKCEIVSKSENLPARFHFIAGHPLGGAPLGGLAYARPDLFKDRPWLFTPINDRTASSLGRLKSFVTEFGARPHLLSPELTASALMGVVGQAVGVDGLRLTGRGLADTTRLASSPATIWRDICSSNAKEIRYALDTFIVELKSLRDGLEEGEQIDRVFTSAAEWRNRLVDVIKKEREKP